MKSPKTIVITGASSGIGAALAEAYAAPGLLLALSGRNARRLGAVAAACRARGARVEEEIVDVTDRAAMQTWLSALDGRRPVDLVIANAGISGGTGGNGAEPAEQARQIFAVNLNGVMNTIDPLLTRMAARGRGQIALMSSLASFSGWPGAPAYSASKAAVRYYGEALRPRMSRKGVQVNVICPGFIKTPMTDVNGYAMPFMMAAEDAAAIIIKGLASNRGRIAFPFRTYFCAGFVGILPPWLSARLFMKLPEKPVLDQEYEKK